MNLLVGRFASPRVPDPTWSACHLESWTEREDGTLELDFELPSDSWVVVTGSNGAGAGTAGVRSTGDERQGAGWPDCGPSP